MNVTLYSTHCPKCIVLEKKLKEKNIQFNIVSDEDAIIKKGFMTVPILEVNDNIMNFQEAMRWIMHNE